MVVDNSAVDRRRLWARIARPLRFDVAPGSESMGWPPGLRDWRVEGECAVLSKKKDTRKPLSTGLFERTTGSPAEPYRGKAGSWAA